ncbi:carboxylating nicotinate-nucleotide diphosphorylase [Chloroflexota bacterium]
MSLFGAQIERLVEYALAEDLGWGDATTDALIPPDLRGEASILVKASGVLAGIEAARMVFHKIDPSLQVKVLIQDGTNVQRGDIAATVEGNLASVLKGERVALNFLQRLSGIASETARYVEAIAGSTACILDTRKTTPGFRLLEKYAVRAGGGKNHRQHLGDGILIKDNHLAGLRPEMGLKEIIAQARRAAPHSLRIEVEVSTPEEALESVEAGADIVMLDNMSLEQMRRAVELVEGRALIEASGGITLDNVRSVAETGADLISVGALTHSVKALDISLELKSKA